MTKTQLKIVTKKDLVNLIIKEAKHILLKEDISQELIQNSDKSGSSLKGNDEIGEFYMVTHPVEGDMCENIVKKVSIPHLMQKIKMGEMQAENIHSIYKKDTTANRQAKKVLKEFNQSLQAGRKLQLEDLENKRKGFQMRLEGSKYSMKGKVLDEDTSMKIKQIEDHISKLDNNISDLQKKIKECKSNLKEGIEASDDLNELFGFGKKQDTPEDEAKRAELKHIDDIKYYAKVAVKGQRGREIGKYLSTHRDDLKYFLPYIPKMSAEVVRDIIIEFPDSIKYFTSELGKLGEYYLYFIVTEHPELSKFLDNLGLKYGNANK